MNKCKCEDFENLVVSHPDVLKFDEKYGWLFSFIELTKESGYYEKHNYGIPISYCPFCGKKI